MPRTIAGVTFLHQPYYCEENVWQLCHHPALAGRRVDVVFVSNPARRVAMWHQRAAAEANAPIVWDYHVFAIAHDPAEVWDLDTDLAMPVPADAYFGESFRPGVAEELAPWFRVIERDEFIRVFASDRSHMKTAEGPYAEPPPPWPAIGVPDRESNLTRLVAMEPSFVGEVKRLESMGFGSGF